MLIPCEKRRLGCEAAVLRKFKTMADCTRACIKYSDDNDLGITFVADAVSRYIKGNTNFSSKRLHVLATILGVTNYREIDEIYTAPEHRGFGYPWQGEFGSTCKDIDFMHIKK